MKNSYKGFDLFADLEDKDLQTRNRAVILTNILEDSHDGDKISSKGSALILGYFNCIPDEEKSKLRDKFVEMAEERGFKLRKAQEMN